MSLIANKQIDFFDGKAMCLMIDDVYASRMLEKRLIGTTWAPRVNGNQWTENKCRNVLTLLITCGFVKVVKSSLFEYVAVQKLGYEYFSIVDARQEMAV